MDFKDYPSSVKEARNRGTTYYFTRKECKNGHLSLRLTSSRECLECSRENRKARVKLINDNSIHTDYLENPKLKYSLPKTRKEANILGKKFYYTGTPCPNGHYSVRSSVNSSCMECHIPLQRNASSNYQKSIKHEEHYKKKNREYQNAFYKTTKGRLTKSLRNRLYQALKSNQKVGSAIRDLGCSIEELKSYLESKFQEGMSWENHGLYGWHIDHINALSNFDLTDREQFLQACHYTNLQPLWAKDNLSKSNKLNWS